MSETTEVPASAGHVTRLSDERIHEALWREYQMSVDLFKFYVDQVVKVLIFYYGITGGILSFYFTHDTAPLARWALMLPCAISFFVLVLFLWGAARWVPLRDNATVLVERLGLSHSFELRIVEILFRASALLVAATGGVMLYLLIGKVTLSTG